MIRLMSLFVILMFSSNAFAAECGLFRVVKGKVTYQQKGKTKFRKARINKKVCQGDTVKTDADSRTKIVMADKNELNISPESQVLIEVYQNASNGNGKVLLDVVYGKVRSNVKQKYKDNKRSHYRVKTKSAVAGVRGTEFMASFNQSTNESRVVTFEGEVMVGEMQGGQFVPQVSVKPGQFTSSSPGTSPHAPRQVPAKELAQMDQESNVNDGARDVSSGNTAKPAPVQKDDTTDDSSMDNEAQPENNEPRETKKPSPVKKPAVGVKPKVSDPKGPTPKVGGIFDNDSDTGDAVGDSAGRDIASVEGGDPMGLPPPSMDDMPTGDGYGTVIEPPRLPSFNNTIVETTPQCLTCNDAVINQNEKVNLTIIPVLEN